MRQPYRCPRCSNPHARVACRHPLCVRERQAVYLCTCCHCGQVFAGHKREVCCPKCKLTEDNP